MVLPHFFRLMTFLDSKDLKLFCLEFAVEKHVCWRMPWCTMQGSTIMEQIVVWLRLWVLTFAVWRICLETIHWIIWSNRHQPKSFSSLCILLHFITEVQRNIICSDSSWIAMSGKNIVQNRLKLLEACGSNQIN